MRAKQIEKLRSERLTAIEGLKSQLEDIKNDDKYATEYKSQKIKELNEQIGYIRHDYEMKITELIASSKLQVRKELDEAEFSNSSAESLTKQMIVEMRNRNKADLLVARYGAEEDISIHEGKLYKKAKDAVKHGLSEAPAYINALERLGLHGAQDLENQYKESTMNAEQRRLNKELTEIEKQANLYEADKVSETMPLRGALMEHYGIN